MSEPSQVIATDAPSTSLKDSFGVICSSLCLVHCLFLPMVLPMLLATGALGTAGALLASEQTHLMLLVPVVLLAVMSFPGGYRRHGSVLPSALALAGLTGLVLALLLGEATETLLTSIGAGLLIIAHLKNRKLQNG